MNSLFSWITIGVVAAAVVVGLYGKIQWDANRSAENKQLNINIAKTNQRIAERRVRDASLDKDDVKRMCTDAGLEWVWDEANARSFCQ